MSSDMGSVPGSVPDLKTMKFYVPESFSTVCNVGSARPVYDARIAIIVVGLLV